MKIVDVLFVEEENSYVVKSEDETNEDYIIVGPEFQFLNTGVAGSGEPVGMGC